MRALAAIPFVVAIGLTGCTSEEPRDKPAAPEHRVTIEVGGWYFDFANAAGAAGAKQRLLVVLALDGSPLAAEARAFLTSDEAKPALEGTVDAVLAPDDKMLRRIGASGVELLYFSPAGIFVGLDKPPFTHESVAKSVREAKSAGKPLDARLEELTSLAGRSSTDPAAYVAVGEFLIGHRSYVVAAEWLRLATGDRMGVSPVRIRGFVMLAECWIAVGDLVQAEDIADELEKRVGPATDDAKAAAIYIRALSDREVGDVDRAIANLEHALKIAPKSPYGIKARELHDKLVASRK